MPDWSSSPTRFSPCLLPSSASSMPCVPRGFLLVLIAAGRHRLGGAALAGVALHGLRPQRRDGLQPLGRPPHRSGQSPHGRPRNSGPERSSARAALRFVIVNALLFVVTASTINLLTGLLSPVALFVILIYSYCKRFTALAHLVLGSGPGYCSGGGVHRRHGAFRMAALYPGAAGDDLVRRLRHHLCVAGRRFRPQERPPLHPGPFFGTGVAPVQYSVGMWRAFAALFWFGSYCPQNGWLWLGEGIFTLILVAEHLLVTPTRQRNIGIAFGTSQRHCEHGAGLVLRNYRSFAGIKSGYFYTFAYSLSIIKYYTYYEYLL